MRKTTAVIFSGGCLVWLIAAFLLSRASAQTPTPAPAQGRAQAQGPAPALYPLEDAFLR